MNQDHVLGVARRHGFDARRCCGERNARRQKPIERSSIDHACRLSSQVIELAELEPGLAKNVVGSRDMEKHIRQHVMK